MFLQDGHGVQVGGRAEVVLEELYRTDPVDPVGPPGLRAVGPAQHVPPAVTDDDRPWIGFDDPLRAGLGTVAEPHPPVIRAGLHESGAMLDWKADISPGWAEIRAEYGQCITFQQVEDYTPPRWPGQQVPQQMHLDVIVDDLDAAEAAVLDLGAAKHEHQPGTSFRVFLDPAGHPFCPCVD